MKLKLLLATALLITGMTAVTAQKKPNIIVILADDMGYSDLGSYGGEIRTPNLDALAAGGIRYRQFYNAARCCPTRASLLTGLYPHQAGMGWMAVADLGTTPAYQDNLNKQCVTIAEALRPAGYHTYMTGKWHVTNERKIDGNVLDNWPVQRGFERYFGIIPGGANYFTPTVYSNNTRYKAPDDFYLTTAISDTSVRYIRDHFAKDDGNPFLLYVAYTAPHWPLHADAETISRYKETYRSGWDKIRAERFARQQQAGLFPKSARLSPRDETVPAWDDLTDLEKEEMTMRMAIYAAQIDILDQGVGRILKTLKEHDAFDNTLIFFLSDNGACAEFISNGESKAVDGTAGTFESYRLPWANVSSTPFREYKHFTHEGGIATPLIVHWPAGIAPGFRNRLVSDYGHITDIMATCVDVAGAGYPARFRGNTITPAEGKSLVPHFSGKPNHRGNVYWEHEANIALRRGKWKLVAKTPEKSAFSKDALELYDLDRDPTELNDLCREHPELVASLYEDWHKWAEKIGAFPLDSRPYGARAQTYRRTVNGQFDDNLGGWNIQGSGSDAGKITVDTTGQLNGANSALISVNQAGKQPGDLSLLWPFRAQKNEKFSVRLTTRSDQPADFIVRLENVENGAVKLLDSVVRPGSAPGTRLLESEAVPEEGLYRIALYFGTSPAQSRIWIDDVSLIPHK